MITIRFSLFLVRKYKIPQYQNGHAYLTTHRACYVDDEDPRRNAVAVDLQDVDHIETYVGSLKFVFYFALIWY
jgi:hypothetical protein